MGIVTFFRNIKKAEKREGMYKLQSDNDFIALQVEMYGEKQLLRLQHQDQDSVRSGLYSLMALNDSKNDSLANSVSPLYKAGGDAATDDDDSDDDDGFISVEYDC
jgi:hypothetical protein